MTGLLLQFLSIICIYTIGIRRKHCRLGPIASSFNFHLKLILILTVSFFFSVTIPVQMASADIPTMDTLLLGELQKLIQSCNDPEHARAYAQDLAERWRKAWTDDTGPQIEKIARQYEQVHSGLMACYLMCQRIVSSHPGSSPLPDAEPDSLTHTFDVSMHSGITRQYQITTRTFLSPPQNVSFPFLH